MGDPFGDRWRLTGVAVLVLVGVGLIVIPAAGPPDAPARSVPVERCELVQLAVYPLDGTPEHDSESTPYRSLTATQRAVFDEARAADGAFVRFHATDHMAAADTLPAGVAVDDRPFRAHSVRGNCPERPWYARWLAPLGALLVALGGLVGGRHVWRRLTY